MKGADRRHFLLVFIKGLEFLICQRTVPLANEAQLHNRFEHQAGDSGHEHEDLKKHGERVQNTQKT